MTKRSNHPKCIVPQAAAQATLFRRYGFVASIVLRVAFYLVWHVTYVH